MALTGVDYSVVYNIDVEAGKAITALNEFNQAVNQLKTATAQLDKIQKELKDLGRVKPKLDIDTTQINNKLDETIRKLQQLNRLSNASRSPKTTSSTASSASSSSSSSRSKPTTRSNSTLLNAPTVGVSASVNRRLPKNLGYQLLGHTPLDVGGVMGVDFLKGMGIAYGISGLGNMMSTVLKEAVEYDNIMKTAYNILKTHDKRNNFEGRFAQMQQTVRDVGVETKFTAPQVASAAKFLSMAGFDIQGINQSIRPISDIALVGDTDLGETADVVTNIMTGYNIAPDKVRNAADVMTMTFTMANTTLMEIAEAYKYSASLLSAGGVSFEESTAALGILGDAGIKGSQAGTSMRTIMANILNPTKKQAAAWRAAGVQRTDKNGRIRPLVEIFEDLAKADLYVDDFYRLFHKTAAQGAVSLANNVQKWNQIIHENFLSGGITKELADEKKNTISGLWSQLTSQFTEDGMKAFEIIQQPIKNLLNDAIAWLSQDSTIDTIKGLVNETFSFVHLIKDVTKTFIKWGKEWKDIIKIWIKFQLYMMPMLAGIKAFKAAFLGISGLVKFTLGVAALADKIGFLSVKVAGFIKQMGFLKAMRMTLSQYFAGTLGASSATATPVATQPIQAGWVAYDPVTRQIIYPDNAAQNNPPSLRSQLKPWGRTAGLMVGGAVGGWAGHSFGKTVSGGSETWGMLGGAVGSLGMMTALAIGGPWGWAAAAAIAIAGISSALYENYEAGQRAAEAFQQYVDATKTVNGILTGEGLSETQQYLELVYNKELSINEVIQKRINLRLQELGLANPNNVNPTENIDGKVMNTVVDLMNQQDHWYGSKQLIEKSAEKLSRYDDSLLRSIVGGDAWWKDIHGTNWWVNNPSGTNDKSDATAALTALYLEGYEGTFGKRIQKEYQKQIREVLLRGKNYQDWETIRQDFDKNIGVIRYDSDTHPSSFEYGLDEISTWDAAKINRAYTFRQGVRALMYPTLGSNAPIWSTAKTYWDNIEGKTLKEHHVIKLLQLADIGLGMLEGYDGKDFDKWAALYGYKNNTFVGADGKPSFQQAEAVKSQTEELLKTLSLLPTEAQDATKQLNTWAQELLNMAKIFLQMEKMEGTKTAPAKVGATKTVNGTKYKFDGKEWQPMNNKVAQPLSNEAMAALELASTTDDDSGSPTGRKTQLGSGDYQSHYKSTSAAPKQVIVKIENLMNVESVDLSNPDNAAVISDLKSQLAQCLIDVVHDFDNTWKG